MDVTQQRPRTAAAHAPIAYAPSPDDLHRERVQAEAHRRGLIPAMTEADWRSVMAAVSALPFPPPYQRKDILMLAPQPAVFDADVAYHGDWVEGIHPLYAIEWIRIRPRFLKHVAQRLPPVLVDIQPELERALKAVGQPYNQAADSIWLVGYR